MPKKAKAEPTKQRKRAHIIASQSLNHVEKFIYDKGFSAERVESDYGYDLIVSTYDSNGYVEPGFILLQLKATDGIRRVENSTFISFPISIKDYRHWTAEGYPVFLIVYDAIDRKAYWIHVQQYFKDDKSRGPGKRATTQGQRPLNRCASKDFQQVVFVPTTATAFHGDARAVGMLLQE
jgi:Domain of unknown function (DUF4365)